MRIYHISVRGAVLIQVNQRKNRDFQEFETLEDVINILKSQFTNRKLYIKYAVDKTEINHQRVSSRRHDDAGHRSEL